MSDERFFFIHMQKTGGTSLWRRLEHHFGDRHIYPNASDGDPVEVAPQLMVPVLVERWHARRDEIRVVTGHFPLCTTELLDGEFRTFTVLRDPVERTLSYLRHNLVENPHEPQQTLEEVYEVEWWFRHFIENHMVRMLALRAEEMESFGMMTILDMDRERLGVAKQALERMDAVGLQEDLEGFARQLEQRHGWDLGKPVRENTTPHTPVPDSFRRRIAEDNALDMELYEHAQELVAR